MELLPCPFCGHPATKDGGFLGDNSVFLVGCQGNPCYALPYVIAPSSSEAIKMWNTRTMLPKPEKAGWTTPLTRNVWNRGKIIR